MSRRRKLLLVVLFLLASCLIISIVFVYLIADDPPFLDASNVQVAKYFISDLAMRKEPDWTHLSTHLKVEIQKRCPNASVLGCTNDLIQPTWGNLERTYFGHGDGDSVLYYTVWSHVPSNFVLILLIVKKENGNWVIDGWLGFTLGQVDNEDSKLLDGRRHDNEFP